MNSSAPLPLTTFDVHIAHGPFAYYRATNGKNKFFPGWGVITTKLASTPSSDASKVHWQKNEFDIIGFIHFDFNIVSTAHISLLGTFTTPEKSTATIRLDKLDYTFQTNTNISNLTFKFSLKNLTIDGRPTVWLNIPSIDAESNSHVVRYAPLGAMNYVIPSMEIVTPGKSIKMQQLAVDLEGKAQKGSLVNYRLAAALHKISVNDQSYGPFVIDINAKNLNSAAFKRCSTSIKKVDEEPKSSQDPRTVFAMIASCAPILGAHSEINIDPLDINLPMGSLRFINKVRFYQTFPLQNIQKLAKLPYPGASSPSSSFFSYFPRPSSVNSSADSAEYRKVLIGFFQDIGNYQKNIDAFMQLQMTEAFMDYVQQQKGYPSDNFSLGDQLTRLGILTKDNGWYTAQSRTMNGKVYLNDQPIEQLLGDR